MLDADLEFVDTTSRRVARDGGIACLEVVPDTLSHQRYILRGAHDNLPQ